MVGYMSKMKKGKKTKGYARGGKVKKQHIGLAILSVV